ncbi:GntR family transcriptional regulator [Phycicoccus sp. M110.8]|uniref:GntR family transcriptional regulator n=1 Tax=Phycicoccus sp. M110.8 TaxID=3075433 RepID=UPI0028FDB243|nr:GntR family transcriptional regulator [Phycicoccus sp. M110.8]MDU0313089.1 GntR family transcriptional regulator [Phycicoccus sp. M110.8]
MSSRRQQGQPDVRKRTLSSVITSQVRRRILDGTYPPGMQLNEVDLATQFATSRGPLREGLQRLVQEGLLISEPHRGVFVPVLTEEDLKDVYFARAAIERAAMIRIVESGLKAADIAALEQALGQMAAGIRDEDWRAVAAADLRFHEVVVEAAGSPRLSRMYATLLGESRLGINLLLSTIEGRTDYVEEHQQIFQHLVAGDREALIKELEGHLQTGLNTLMTIAPGDGTGVVHAGDGHG